MATFAIDLLTGKKYLLDGSFSGATGTTSGSTYPSVGTFSELPTPASSHTGDIYVVRNPSGSYITGIKDAGLYWSNGTDWVRLGDITQYFNSNNFQVYDNVDNTKGFEFNTGNISSGVFRTITIPNKNGTLIYQADVNTYTGTTAPNTFLKLNQATPQKVINGIPQFDGIQFNVTGTTPTKSVGKLIWGDDGTLEFGLNSSVNLQIGQETLINVRNNTNNNMYNGQIVYVTGGLGSQTTIELADVNIGVGFKVVAMLTQDLPKNTRGFATVFGLVRDLNTSMYSGGTTLYLSLTAGTFSNILPPPPKCHVRIGVVLYSHAVHGIVLFAPQSATRVTALADVNGTPLTATGQLMVYHSDTKVFDFDYNINNYVSKVELSGKTLQNLYNQSTSPQITTSTSLGAVTLRRGSTVDSDIVFQTQNGTGGTTSNINGNGLLTVREIYTGNASGHTEFEPDGTMVAYDAALTWRDEFPGGQWVLGAGGAAPDIENYTIGGVPTRKYVFDGTSLTESMSNTFEMPHDAAYDAINSGNTFIEAHVHWRPTTNNAGTVVFKFQWSYSVSNQAIAPISGETLIASASTLANNAFYHRITSFKTSTNVVKLPKPTGVDFSLGDLIDFLISRNPADDTYPDDVIVEQVALHFPCDMLGSRDRYIK